MADFKRLDVWKAAHDVTLKIYRATRHFPHEERFGLTNQLRRAAVSTAAAIAEGYGRGGDKEFARYLAMSLGESNEVEYYLIQATDLGYLCDPDLQESVQVVARKLSRLRARVLRSVKNP